MTYLISSKSSSASEGDTNRSRITKYICSADASKSTKCSRPRLTCRKATWLRLSILPGSQAVDSLHPHEQKWRPDGTLIFVLVRVRRIELPTTAWKAVVLPLNYTRKSYFFAQLYKKFPAF